MVLFTLFAIITRALQVIFRDRLLIWQTDKINVWENVALNVSVGHP